MKHEGEEREQMGEKKKYTHRVCVKMQHFQPGAVIFKDPFWSYDRARGSDRTELAAPDVCTGIM
jgi:hypothetical protein